MCVCTYVREDVRGQRLSGGLRARAHGGVLLARRPLHGRGVLVGPLGGRRSCNHHTLTAAVSQAHQPVATTHGQSRPQSSGHCHSVLSGRHSIRRLAFHFRNDTISIIEILDFDISIKLYRSDTCGSPGDIVTSTECITCRITLYCLGIQLE